MTAAPRPAWAERHQVVLYLGAIAAAALLGLAVPAVALPLEHAITPVLGLLLYATFLGIPFSRVARAARDGRFIGVVTVVNFVLVPLVVWGLSRFVAHDAALLVGVLLVLLTPCIDYVVVFTGIAGGDRERLLAVTPLLMLAQVVLLPAYLWLMAGPDVLASFDARPFAEAFLLLIVLPLGLAAATQALARRSRFARGIVASASVVMVPLMMLTLAVVVASQVSAVGGQLVRLAPVVPVFVGFVLLAVPVAALAARLARLAVPARRAVVFSGTTRNSLVVLPLALAAPAPLVPLVVVTQTLVELVALVGLVAIVPRLIRPRGTAAEGPLRRAN